MREIRLKIENPELFIQTLETIQVVDKESFFIKQNITNKTIFEGKANSENLNYLLELAQRYGQNLFLSQNKLILTGRKHKISKIIYKGNKQYGFLYETLKIKLIGGKEIEINLSFLGNAESTQFDRVFKVMTEKDKLEIEKFVEFTNQHYLTSFRQTYFNIGYIILNNNLLFFKCYNEKKIIELDSLIEVEWKK